jgi:hypothetical protein
LKPAEELPSGVGIVTAETDVSKTIAGVPKVGLANTGADIETLGL